VAELLNNFETGVADGTTITTANSDDGTAGAAFDAVNASGTREFDTGITLHGTRTLLLGSASGTTPYVAWSTSWTASTDLYVRMYFRVSALPTSGSATIILVRNSTDSPSSPPVELRISTTGKLQIRINSVLRHTSSATISVDTWYRVELHCNAPSGTTAYARGRLFTGANLEGATADEAWGSTTAYTAGDGTFGGCSLGWASTPTATTNMSIDSVGISDVDWLGSVAPTVDDSFPVAAVIGMYAGSGDAAAI
jgi:hypothetical protein